MCSTSYSDENGGPTHTLPKTHQKYPMEHIKNSEVLHSAEAHSAYKPAKSRRLLDFLHRSYTVVCILSSSSLSTTFEVYLQQNIKQPPTLQQEHPIYTGLNSSLSTFALLPQVQLRAQPPPTPSRTHQDVHQHVYHHNNHRGLPHQRGIRSIKSHPGRSQLLYHRRPQDCCHRCLASHHQDRPRCRQGQQGQEVEERHVQSRSRQ